MRIAAVAFVLALVGCAGPQAHEGLATGWQKEALHYARSFELWHNGDDRLLIVFGHGGRTDTAAVIHRSSDTAFAALPFEAMRLSAPLQRLALLSTTHVPYLTAIDKGGSIAGTVLPQEVRDSALQAALAEGRVQGLGTTEMLERERLIALRPDAVLGYPFGAQGHATLRAAGLHVVQVAEYLEEHPLGRAEWLRFFGVLTGAEARADSVFKGIVERYEAVVAEARKDTVRPTVFFGSQWNGLWSAPPGNSYMARLITDAGGRYVFAERTANGNIDLDMETMLSVVSKVDVWGMIASIEGEPRVRDLTNGDARLNDLAVVERSGLFCGNTRTADLFGQALLEPDRVLADLRWCIGNDRSQARWEEEHPYFRPVRPDVVTVPPGTKVLDQ